MFITECNERENTSQSVYDITFNGFYRATLCVSAVIAVARCLSVSLSRWCILSTRLKISSNFFLRPVDRSPITLVFDPRHRYPIPISKGNPFTGGAKYTGVGKNRRNVYLGNGTRYAHGCY